MGKETIYQLFGEMIIDKASNQSFFDIPSLEELLLKLIEAEKKKEAQNKKEDITLCLLK